MKLESWFFLVLGLIGWLLFCVAARYGKRMRRELTDEIMNHLATKKRTGDYGSGYIIRNPPRRRPQDAGLSRQT